MAGLVSQWTDAWNACDVDGIVALAHPELRMHRMKGEVVSAASLCRGTSLSLRLGSSTGMSRTT